MIPTIFHDPFVQKVVIFIIGGIVSNYFHLIRDKRKEFNDATEQVRQLLNTEIRHLSNNKNSISDRLIPELEAVCDYIPLRHQGSYESCKAKYKEAYKSHNYTNADGDVVVTQDIPHVLKILQDLKKIFKRR
ncbi:hypothetical protein [Shewanella sp. yb_14]|uniref:hypothetical protein n=1 Tax=unclassified Shewanella TaxID=196818 RepID=UPI00370A15C4